jgi:predicted nucleic acid-binding protein
VLDILIGACAWAEGRATLTRNRTDLEAVARELAVAWPDQPLAVRLPDA